MEIVVENTTIADIQSPAARQAFITLFRERYTEKIDFILVRRQFPQIENLLEVFPDVPMIITDQNLALARQWETPPNTVHEVRYAIRVDKLAQAALQMGEQTTKIIIIAGLDPFDQSFETSAREQLGSSYNGVEVTYWSGVPVPEMLTRVSSLPGDHLVIFLATTVDKNGVETISADVVKKLSAAASVPIFGIADTFMPNGIVGGYVLSSTTSGRRAAEMMNQLLQGKPLPGSTQVEDYGLYQFDGEQLRRWGIPEYRAPGNSVIVNRPASFFARNIWLIPALGTAGVVLGFSTLLLLWHLRYRRIAERALLASKARLIDAERLAEMGDFTWNVETGEMSWSDALFDLLHYDKSEKIDYTKVNREMHHPDDLQRVSQWLQDCIAAGKTMLTPNEYRIIRKDGRVLHVRTQGVIQREAGKQTRIFATVQDITERKQMEENLRASAKRFRALFEQAGSYCMILDPNTADGIPIIVEANKAAYETHGYTREEFIGRPVADLDDEEGKSQVVQHTQQIMTGKPFFTENTHLRKDGTAFSVAVHANRIDIAEEPPLIYTTEYDITDRKTVEEALQKSEEHFRGIFEQSPIAIQLYDKEEKLVDVNVQTLELLGIEQKKDLLGYDMWIFRHMMTDKMATLKNGKPVFMEANVDFDAAKKTNLFPTRRSGTIYIEIHAAPLFREHEISGYLIQIVEVTQRKLMESQLQHSQKMESVGRLAGGVAHDFNNLLSIIIGFTDMAMEKVEPKDPLHGDLKEVLTAANRSRDITRQLLAFARKEIISPEVLDLNACVEKTLKLLRRLIGEDIELTWLPSDQILPVLMDRAQLEQILANLCVNARDAIADVGNVTIVTDTMTANEDFTTQADIPAGEYVALLVSDNGHGMDQETIKNIFEPFFTTKDVGKGTGLGLATVHGIVKQNKGFIHADSKPGEGTTFRIYLPKHQEKLAENRVQVDKSDARGQGETLLVVEDDSAILKLAERVLVSQKYKVFKSTSPVQALEIAQMHTGGIDLLITDVVMPGMNGKELAGRIQAMHPRIKTLYMSGYTDNIIADRGVISNGVQFIGKPFSPDDLCAKVRIALDADSTGHTLPRTAS